MRGADLNADGLAIQERSACLLAISCLAGSLVSLGLAATEWAEHADHNRVGSLAILGMIIGALAGLTAAVSVEKPHGRADRIKIVTAWLGLIGFAGLFLLSGVHMGGYLADLHDSGAAE